jgi:hypothetical protein
MQQKKRRRKTRGGGGGNEEGAQYSHPMHGGVGDKVKTLFWSGPVLFCFKAQGTSKKKKKKKKKQEEKEKKEETNMCMCFDGE